MPTDLLLTRKPILPIPSTLSPITIIVWFPAPDMHLTQMRREIIACAKRLPAVCPMTDMNLLVALV